MLMISVLLILSVALILMAMRTVTTCQTARVPVASTRAQIAWYRQELALGHITPAQFTAIKRELLR
ncbi:hypothetical protein [Lacticaseibacillus manihotivorans]|jgi:uncharacterized membrane protein|uniref:Uncharacterized protein n=2 Tax=Lacticaseibacillus manihotivorans TaxID=88233 RepID=A0A0R1PVV4_9LACO|nr:hypothetical protein [Lacticaseibacillus manihotivorans]KRL36711.1 hypothetical protein FD01_GL002941 [Lacticaseibacillus manihotivorans DSM 13343 = JCM 12514]QFQ91717.1 hypothetical protein LM010_09875 [Lacticaseibacillus manihotivorans]